MRCVWAFRWINQSASVDQKREAKATLVQQENSDGTASDADTEQRTNEENKKSKLAVAQQVAHGVSPAVKTRPGNKEKLPMLPDEIRNPVVLLLSQGRSGSTITGKCVSAYEGAYSLSQRSLCRCSVKAFSSSNDKGKQGVKERGAKKCRRVDVKKSMERYARKYRMEKTRRKR